MALIKKLGVEYLRVSKKAIIISVLFTVLGLFLAILGDKAIAVRNLDRDNLNVFNVLVILVLAVVGYSGYAYSISIVAGYGYS